MVQPNTIQHSPGDQALLIAAIITAFACFYLLCYMWLNSPCREIPQDNEQSLFLHKSGVSQDKDDEIKRRLQALKERLNSQNALLSEARQSLDEAKRRLDASRNGGENV